MQGAGCKSRPGSWWLERQKVHGACFLSATAVQWALTVGAARLVPIGGVAILVVTVVGGLGTADLVGCVLVAFHCNNDKQ